jgi:glucuronoarabinoxylan endo-1,4-beta-xylanase
MKQFFTSSTSAVRRLSAAVILLASVTAANAVGYRLTIKDTRYQTVTGFGAACCDGAMCPFGTDTNPVRLLYGPTSKVGLNIMRMEISPNFEGDIKVPEWGNWDSPYDWNGSLPSAKIVKQRGGIVFGTPWSPPGDFKTNGSAQGGNADDQGNQEGRLRKDCYEKFFPWLNQFLGWMQDHGVNVDAVSVQNEPDWWVSYSGCLYTPEEQLDLVKNYAYMLDREKYNGVRLISAEPLGFRPDYANALLNDVTARKQIDIIAGHIYGHEPLGNMKTSAKKAAQYGKEVWMTEHSSTDNIGDRLPTWHEQLLFAEELNECMLAGGTGYIYWYMRAHWAFVSTGEAKYGTENKTKNKLLPRAYVMSHFAKHVTGSTRLGTSADMTEGKEAAMEFSAYIKGDSLILMAIDTTATSRDLKLKLPYKVKSGVHILSTGNELENLCQESEITIDDPVDNITVEMPARSLNTYIFMIDNGSTAIKEVDTADSNTVRAYYDLRGRRLETPRGLCIEKYADGSSKKVFIKD